jgi:hypothetical protein
VLKQKFVEVLVYPGGPPASENRKCKEQRHQHNHVYLFTLDKIGPNTSLSTPNLKGGHVIWSKDRWHKI